MPAVERLMVVATRRARQMLADIGRALRAVRITHGLSQRTLAGAVGISQTQLSRIERGLYPAVTLETLTRIGAALGLDVSVRWFPSGEPIRDKAHAALLERLRNAVGEIWQWSAEVPLPIPGDRRAWDRTLTRDGNLIGIEAETRPTDMQELQRRLTLKKRDGRVDRLILVLANTQWCRRLVRLNDMDSTFPVPGRVALKALAEGRDPGGDAVILI
jgi:transcriptional regulator with XRE-family HTH domain